MSEDQTTWPRGYLVDLGALLDLIKSRRHYHQEQRKQQDVCSREWHEQVGARDALCDLHDLVLQLKTTRIKGGD